MKGNFTGYKMVSKMSPKTFLVGSYGYYNTGWYCKILQNFGTLRGHKSEAVQEGALIFVYGQCLIIYYICTEFGTILKRSLVKCG